MSCLACRPFVDSGFGSARNEKVTPSLNTGNKNVVISPTQRQNILMNPPTARSENVVISLAAPLPPPYNPRHKCARSLHLFKRLLLVPRDFKSGFGICKTGGIADIQ